MIMRITWGRIHPGKWDEYEKMYNATVVAKSKNIKGLRGRWLAQDMTDKDSGYAVSLWDSVEDMQAYEQSDFYKNEILPPSCFPAPWREAGGVMLGLGRRNASLLQGAGSPSTNSGHL
jgi:heme-degrading monooxygenase HmoA